MAAARLFGDGVEALTTFAPQPVDWLGAAPTALAIGSVAAATRRLLVIDGFLRESLAIELAQILATRVTFAPRFGLRSNGVARAADRGMLVDADTWSKAPAENRFFRFEAIDDLSTSAADVGARLRLLEFWRLLAGDAFRHWLESQTKRACCEVRLEAHRMAEGDFIGPHSDARAGRTVGLFVYLTPGWNEEDGGVLKIEDGAATIPPWFNRAVIFDVDGHSSHEVPPLPRRAHRARLSFGVWYHNAS